MNKKQIDLSTSVEYIDWYNSIKDNFNLFRTFLQDDIDAIVVHLIVNKAMSESDAAKLEAGLRQAAIKIAQQYPAKIPQSTKSKFKALKSKTYEIEDLNHLIVFHLTEMIVHLQASMSVLFAPKV